MKHFIPVAVIALVTMATGGTGHAAECKRTYFLDQYKAAVAAQRKGDAAQAENIFRQLAQDGFAPAQRRVGQAMLETNNRAEGLAWLRRAMVGGDDLAVEAWRAAKTDADEASRARAEAETWRPTLPDCMREFQNRFRAGERRRLDDFVESLSLSRKVTHSPEEVGRRFMALLVALDRDDPTFLPYLRALGPLLVGLRGASAMPLRDDTKSALAVDIDMLMDPNPERLRSFLAFTIDGIRTAVHDQADPPNRLESKHRGRTIVAYGYSDAHQAMSLIKAGIDVADGLPPDLKAHAATVKTLRYEAPARSMDVRATGTYLKNDNLIWFGRSPDYMTPRDIAASLVANGMYAQAASNGSITGQDVKDQVRRAGQRVRDILVGQ